MANNTSVDFTSLTSSIHRKWLKLATLGHQYNHFLIILEPTLIPTTIELIQSTTTGRVIDCHSKHAHRK